MTEKEIAPQAQTAQELPELPEGVTPVTWDVTPEHLMIDTAEKMYSEKYLDRNRKLFPLLALFTKPSSYERFFRNADAILHFDARKELPMITAPTLIIAGSEDQTVGNYAAEELKQGISGSELFVYEGLGHGAYEEAKDFYDRVLAYCNQ